MISKRFIFFSVIIVFFSVTWGMEYGGNNNNTPLQEIKIAEVPSDEPPRAFNCVLLTLNEQERKDCEAWSKNNNLNNVIDNGPLYHNDLSKVVMALKELQKLTPCQFQFSNEELSNDEQQLLLILATPQQTNMLTDILSKAEKRFEIGSVNELSLEFKEFQLTKANDRIKQLKKYDPIVQFFVGACSGMVSFATAVWLFSQIA